MQSVADRLPMSRDPVVHGGVGDAELRAQGLSRDGVLDFSSNVNPLGASPLVRKAVAKADLSAYPDRDCLLLREALAARLDVGVENLLIGNGSTELIHLLARAFLGPQACGLILAPTFGEYEAAARIASADVHVLEAVASTGFNWSIQATVQAIQELRPSVVFLCNPNNPTGVYVHRAAVRKLSIALGPTGLLVLDTSYAPFADEPWDATPLLRCGNVTLLRSMTKDHGLAGVRLGYMAARPPIVEATRRLQPTWSVSSIAQAAGIAALADEAHVVAARCVIRESKAYLYDQLAAMGVPALPSAANFVLARVGDATAVRQELLSAGIVVRDCTSFGLPAYIRIAVRRRDECARLIDALRNVLGHG